MSGRGAAPRKHGIGTFPGLLLVHCSFGLNGLLYGSLLSRYAEIADAVQASEAAFGLILAAGAFGGLLGSILAPLVVRFLGDAGAATAFGCAFAVLAIGVAGAPTVALLAAVLVVMTVVDGGQDVAMNALAVRIQQARNRSVLGRAHAVWSLALAAGTAVGTAAAVFQVPIVGHIAAVAIVVAAVQLGAWWPVRNGSVSDPGSPGGSRGQARQGSRRTALLRGPGGVLLVLLAAAAVAASFVESPGQEWTALLLARGFDADAGLAAAGPLAFSLGLVAARLVLDPLLHRVPRSLISAMAGATIVVGSAAGLLLGLFGGPAWPLLLALVVIGVGAGPVFPLLFGAAELLAHRHEVPPATTASVVSACSRVGAISAPALVGAVTEASSLLAVLVVMGAGGLAMALVLPRTLHHDRPRAVREHRPEESS